MPVSPLQANRSMATLNELMWTLTTAGEADRPRLWAIVHQFNGSADDYLREGGTREEWACGYGVSARQLRRWISKFNEGGIPGLLERRFPKHGRKRKINGSDFREKILKLAEQQAQGASARALYTWAKNNLGIDISYPTFMRYLGAGSARYRRPAPIPTIEEQMAGISQTLKPKC